MLPASVPPKDGLGPRGVPDCYYTSRVLNSTARYVRFVKKLRALEEEQRRGQENKLRMEHDQHCNDFFIKCDRRSLINTVAQRVDICLASYEEHLDEKRNRLKELLSLEEEQNIRRFVEQAQEGAAAAWRDKLRRLEFLEDKRRKEHQEKYADTPLSKCAHVTPCLVKLRAQQAQEAQLQQRQERTLRQAATLELDRMWHQVTLKEAEALAARLELDVMERRRRDEECARHTEEQLRQNAQRRAQERERLKREACELRADHQRWEDEQAEEKLKHFEKGKQIAEERQTAIRERQEVLEQQRRDEALVQHTWDSLRGQNIPVDRAREERRRQKERDLDQCNRKMLELKHGLEQHRASGEPLVLAEGQRRRDVLDLERCLRKRAQQRATLENSEAVKQQLKEKSKEREEAQQRAAEHCYQQQVEHQLQQLEAHRELQAVRTKQRHRTDLVEQIKYNQLIKERALQEEMEQRVKCERARQQYQEEIKGMLNRAPRAVSCLL